MSTERIERLEERMAWLERHVVEQDKAMLALAETNDRLRRELEIMRLRSGGESTGPTPAEERPPHY
jgi:SlyX protein